MSIKTKLPGDTVNSLEHIHNLLSETPSQLKVSPLTRTYHSWSSLLAQSKTHGPVPWSGLSPADLVDKLHQERAHSSRAAYAEPMNASNDVHQFLESDNALENDTHFRPNSSVTGNNKDSSIIPARVSTTQYTRQHLDGSHGKVSKGLETSLSVDFGRVKMNPQQAETREENITKAGKKELRVGKERTSGKIDFTSRRERARLLVELRQQQQVRGTIGSLRGTVRSIAMHRAATAVMCTRAKPLHMLMTQKRLRSYSKPAIVHDAIEKTDRSAQRAGRLVNITSRPVSRNSTSTRTTKRKRDHYTIPDEVGDSQDLIELPRVCPESLVNPGGAEDSVKIARGKNEPSQAIPQCEGQAGNDPIIRHEVSNPDFDCPIGTLSPGDYDDLSSNRQGNPPNTSRVSRSHNADAASNMKPPATKSLVQEKFEKAPSLSLVTEIECKPPRLESASPHFHSREAPVATLPTDEKGGRSRLKYVLSLLESRNDDVRYLRSITSYLRLGDAQIDEALARLRDGESVKKVMEIVMQDS